MLKKLLIIVPTRNRPLLARNAVKSILEGVEDNIEVLLSDNSTNPNDTKQLTLVVSDIADTRLVLVRPPEPLPMTEHWDWVLETASRRPDVSHVIVLTDRMIFKSGALAELLPIVASRPEEIVCYNHDRVADLHEPIRAELQPWSNQLLSVSSNRLLELSAHCIFPQALPRLLNCATPLSVLREIKARYGDYVSSISPDYSFCYRALCLVGTVTYWDRAALVHYALDRSNGESTARGVETPDNADFLRATGNENVFARPCAQCAYPYKCHAA